MDTDPEVKLEDDGSISIVETQQVAMETFDPVDLDNQIDSLQSELDNFDVITSNRHTWLEDRLTTLQAVKAKMEEM